MNAIYKHTKQDMESLEKYMNKVEERAHEAKEPQSADYASSRVKEPLSDKNITLEAMKNDISIESRVQRIRPVRIENDDDERKRYKAL